MLILQNIPRAVKKMQLNPMLYLVSASGTRSVKKIKWNVVMNTMVSLKISK